MFSAAIEQNKFTEKNYNKLPLSTFFIEDKILQLKHVVNTCETQLI